MKVTGDPIAVGVGVVSIGIALISAILILPGRKGQRPVDGVAVVHLNGSRGRIVLPLVDDALGARRDRIVDEDVDMVFGSQERANVTVQCEVGQFAPLDGLANICISGVH